MDATQEAFTTAYKKLNTEQKEAVDAIEGPVMVVAGPGTGKTQILTLRIANILTQTDVGPENILALTFTESGAKAMRERLRAYIGPAAYRVAIHTFHGFSEELIRRYPDAYERIIGGRAIREIEQIDVIEDILENDPFSYIRPSGNPSFYVPHIIRTIKELKQEYIAPDGFASIIKEQEAELNTMERVHDRGAHKGKVTSAYQNTEKMIAKNKELLTVYRTYEAYCREVQVYDYEDMIVETVRALESNEDMKLDLQETYQYILADEHQDVNGSQNRILELLSSYHASPNLFVVGDEKQAIFRFQGASLENFLYFEDAFTGTKTIALTKSYRSGQRILDASHSLISSQDGPASDLRVPLGSKSEISKAAVEQRRFSHQAVEDMWVAEDIKERIAKGTPKHEIAVIVRTNREVKDMTALIRKQQVPVVPSAESDILMHPITHSIQKLIAAVTETNSEEVLFTVLHGAYWGIHLDDLLRVCAARSHARPLASLMKDRSVLSKHGVEDTEAVLKVFQTLKKARDRETYDAPHRVLEYLLRESGFLDHVLHTEPLEGGRVVRRLYDEIESMVIRGIATDLRGVARVLEQHIAHGVPLNAPFIGNQDDAVQVMTAHKAKGLEFSCVYVPHLSDSKWGGKRKPEYFKIPLLKHLKEGAFDRLDDERRLLYVAMTRAKETLSLSYAEVSSEGRSLVPSRLLEELDEECCDAVETEEEEDAFDPIAPLTTAATPHAIDKALLKHLFFERGLSVTALNNYLRSPWDYFYRNVLRMPEVQSEPLLFGDAMHKVMEVVARHIQEHAVPPDTSKLSAWLDRELGRLPITDSEYTRLHEKGLESLTMYVEHMYTDISTYAKQEFSLRVVMETEDPEMPEVPLTGIIDRLDLTEEGEAIQFVDYKTGKPHTRNVIEGKTQSSKGEYKRQLVFYALLLSLSGDERYHCREGAISFLQPDQKGRVRHERFTITEEEIRSLREEIVRVAKEITSGAFLAVSCDPNESSYCQYVAELFGTKE